MRSVFFSSLVVLLALGAVPAGAEDHTVRVRLATSAGSIVLELDAGAAPATVENFLDYADSGFYDGTIFHRVIPGFMIQGGGFTPKLDKKPTGEPVQNEANNGAKNLRGTIAMARTSDPHSATAQFFINSVDNASLDHSGETRAGWGYTVFGRVVEGMEVVDAISRVPTGVQGRMRDVPSEPVILESVERLGAEADAASSDG